MKKDRIIELDMEPIVKGDTYLELFQPIMRGTNELIDPETFDGILMDIRTGPNQTDSLVVTAKMVKDIDGVWEKQHMDIIDNLIEIKIPGDITKLWNAGEYYRDIRFIKVSVVGFSVNYDNVVSRGYGKINVYNGVTEIPGY